MLRLQILRIAVKPYQKKNVFKKKKNVAKSQTICKLFYKIVNNKKKFLKKIPIIVYGTLKSLFRFVLNKFSEKKFLKNIRNISVNRRL